MKNIKAYTVFLGLIVAVIIWEITASFICESQMDKLIEEEVFSLKLKSEMPLILSRAIAESAAKRGNIEQMQKQFNQNNRYIMEMPSTSELKEQAEENIRKRGNPYSLFR